MGLELLAVKVGRLENFRSNSTDCWCFGGQKPTQDNIFVQIPYVPFFKDFLSSTRGLFQFFCPVHGKKVKSSFLRGSLGALNYGAHRWYLGRLMILSMVFPIQMSTPSLQQLSNRSLSLQKHQWVDGGSCSTNNTLYLHFIWLIHALLGHCYFSQLLRLVDSLLSDSFLTFLVCERRSRLDASSVRMVLELGARPNRTCALHTFRYKLWKAW